MAARAGPVTREEVEGIVRGGARGHAAFEVTDVAPYAAALAVGSPQFERLEFLGDAIVGAVVAQYLFERFPRQREDFLTRMRSKMVCGTMLARMGEAVGLADHLRTDDGARPSETALDDAFEAFAGAMWEDAGFLATRAWLRSVVEERLDVSALVSHHDSCKEQLLRSGHRVAFVEVAGGGGHGRPSRVSVCVRDGRTPGVVLGTATASTRRAAEEEASRKALAFIGGRAMLLPRDALASFSGSSAAVEAVEGGDTQI